MKIVDTHVHYWDLGLKKNDWLLGEDLKNGFLGDYQRICHNFLPADLSQHLPADLSQHLPADLSQHLPADLPQHLSADLPQHLPADDALTGTVHIQAGWPREDSVAETAWIASLNDGNAQPIICIAYANMADSALAATIEQHCAYDCFKGFRQILSWHKNPMLSSVDKNYAQTPLFHQGLRMLNQHSLQGRRLVFEIQAYPQQLQLLLPTIKQCAAVNFVVEHCGLPIFQELREFEIWSKVLKQATQLDNVYLKISGLDMCQCNTKMMFEKETMINLCIDYFGVERIVFGSNFPVESLYTTYAQTLKDITAIGLTQTEYDKIFSQNALRIYQ